MAWKKVTHCQQCKRKLSKQALAARGRICPRCCATNHSHIWDRSKEAA